MRPFRIIQFTPCKHPGVFTMRELTQLLCIIIAICHKHGINNFHFRVGKLVIMGKLLIRHDFFPFMGFI